MFGLHRVRFAILAACCVPVSGCGGGSVYIPAANPYGAAYTVSAARAVPAALDVAAPESFADAPDASLAGTYDGTFVEKTGGVTSSGTLVITLKISGTADSGDFVLTRGGKSATVTYTGTGRHTKHGYKMSLVGVASNGCKATGPATIAGRKFSGSFAAPACGTDPSATFTYKALKAAI
jgi:hypothetical protein